MDTNITVGGRRRKSRDSLESVPDDFAKKSRLSLDTMCDGPISAETLAKKLDEVSTDMMMIDNNAAVVELRGFETAGRTAEQYHEMREKVRMLANDPDNFDTAGRTELNIESAAIAGAKLLIDEYRATRSMSKALKETCGIEENEILYKPIPFRCSESKAVKELGDNRQASVVESLVDYKKQIQFKSNVLQHVADGAGFKHGRKASRKDLLPSKTPSQHMEWNPLDGNRIIDEYALEVASEVRDASRKKRQIAPIPFNINLLDDEDDQMY